MKNQTHARRLAAGKCKDCGERDHEEGKTRCSSCSSRHAEDGKGRWKKRVGRGRCANCGETNGSKFAFCASCREVAKKRQKIAGPKTRRKARDEAFAAYGGPQCKCCGETELLVLSLDHIAGGGCRHEKELGSLGSTLYAHLRARRFPTGYQVLCFNCNVGKYRNGGTCPIHNKKLT